MHSKFPKLLTVGVIVLLALVATVQADGNLLKVSPSRIPKNEKVTISFTSSGTNKIDKIQVTGPDGTLYVKDYDPDITLLDGEELTEEFGTSVGGWTPSADTSKEGWYTVVLIGYEPPYRMEDYFDVSRKLYVPEFALPSMILTAVGFALLNIKRKITKKKF